MSLASHLPALQVIVPLLAAPLTVLLRHRHAAYAVVLVAAWSALAIALALMAQVTAHGTISYPLGSWEPPWGIEYRVDRLSSMMLVLLTGIAAVVLPATRASIEAELPRAQHYLFYTMFSLCLAGLLGMSITGDAFNIFVFLEISSLSTYVLIALGKDRRALVAAYQYLIVGTIGATFFVIGIGLLYLQTGTLNLADMGQRLHGITGDRAVLAALAFVTVGLSLKLALFPLHQWLPNAYAFAPSVVSAFLAASATKVAIYVLIRFYFSVFGESAVFERLPTQEVMLLLALGAMFVASTIACFQVDLKRLFAYSSVSQVGYIVLGIALGSVSGLTGGIAHIINHAVAKGGIFLFLAGVTATVGTCSLEQLRGLGRRMPLTAFGITLCGLSLIGIPGTAGFISKWYLVLAALERGHWWLVFLIVVSSLIALVYVWRFVETAYMRAPDEPQPTLSSSGRAPLSIVIAAWVLAAAVIYLGLDTSFTVGQGSAAATELLQRMR